MASYAVGRHSPCLLMQPSIHDTTHFSFCSTTSHILTEILGYNGSDYDEYWLLGCDTVQLYGSIKTTLRILLLPQQRREHSRNSTLRNWTNKKIIHSLNLWHKVLPKELNIPASSKKLHPFIESENSIMHSLALANCLILAKWIHFTSIYLFRIHFIKNI
jgi:hypothetical protein